MVEGAEVEEEDVAVEVEAVEGVAVGEVLAEAEEGGNEWIGAFIALKRYPMVLHKT